jgi:hypothetical protein
MIALAVVVGLLFLAFALTANLGDVRLYLFGGATLGVLVSVGKWWAKSRRVAV